MTKFYLVTIILFISFAIVGVLMFAGFIPTPRGGNTNRDVVVLEAWGTLPEASLDAPIRLFNEEARKKLKIEIRYAYVSGDDFELELLRSIAGGSAPDILLFPENLLLTIGDKLLPIPVESLSERSFKELFIEGAELFIDERGPVALPLLVDPLVLYWNRDIFNNERIATVPKTWSELVSFARLITEKDERGKIVRSAVALGEGRNIQHVKEIISLLLLQAGDLIVKRGGSDGKIEVVLGRGGLSEGRTPAESVLSYYSGFADPVKPHNSWNSSFVNSFDSFAAGHVGIYFGPASDFGLLARRNPHLNFAIEPVPQLEGTPKEVTFGTIYAVGVLDASKHKDDAFRAIYDLAIAENKYQLALAEALSLPPAKRILLGGFDDPVLATFAKEALIARSWLDPKPSETTTIFITMAQGASSKIVTTAKAIENAVNQLGRLLK